MYGNTKTNKVLYPRDELFKGMDIEGDSRREEPNPTTMHQDMEKNYYNRHRSDGKKMENVSEESLLTVPRTWRQESVGQQCQEGR